MAFTADELDFVLRNEVNPDGFALTKRAAFDDARLARERYGAFGRAALELLTARAAGKVPDNWLVDSEAAQQATPPPVAAERAARLAGYPIHDVTCSVGTEGRFIDGPWIGSDLDPIRVRMAAHNLPGRLVLRADALHPVSRGCVIVADPARRSGGRRLKDTIPPLPDLFAAWPDTEMAIKCAPGIDYSGFDGAVVVSSVDGGVKETCLYTPGLARPGVRREAIIHREGRCDRLDDTLPDDVPAAAPGRYILDPDGAIVRAGLVRHFAAREGLWQLDERIAYLTGDTIPSGYSGFEFREQVPLKRLRSALARHDAGRAEILVRGVDVDPDALRARLKLRGSTAVTIVCTRIGRDGVALICGPREFTP
ncbi:THUMP-like domain-containing protein [Corynebacterium uterequi]|uniref:THUMP-like domain-containing protein n=1 Tax=Corynebacterium uterequi TaxID=1072256 RepID=A0A0G3HBZ0_9CORY|nr:hypothetical protein [Corynebacterium uterequi]AKK10911.1 hypothetical protein CUTER_04530 [Corynebacterium uterequi]